jgi:hypothetical protein
MDRDRLVADVASQPSDDGGMVAIESVCDTEYPGEPLDKLTPVGIKGSEFSVPGGIWQCLRMVPGNEGASQSVAFVQARDREFQDYVAAQLVVFS